MRGIFMTYNWDIDCLVQGRDKVKKLYEEEQDKKEKLYYKKLLRNIDEFIKTKYKYTQVTEISINDRLEEIVEDIEEYRPYYELASNLTRIIYRSHNSFSVIEERLEKVIGDSDTIGIITGAKVTRSHALSLANKFYKGFSQELIPIFKPAYKQRYTSVLFSKHIGKNTDASSTYFDILNKYFINVGATTDVAIVYSIIHEYGHILGHIVNPKPLILDHDFWFDEVGAIFPEMIAKYENIGDYERIQSLFELYSDFINYTDMANALDHHIPISNIWSDYRQQTCKRFFKEIEQDFGFSKNELENDVLASRIEDDGTYTTSFLVAVELFHIYKKDKEKALKLYNEIIRIPYNESIFKFVNDNMKLTEHLEEETNVLLDEFSIELKKKGI